jgi:heme-degrading monooxygenase HmoA
MQVAIFYSQLKLEVADYSHWADAMLERVQVQPGFIRAHSFRNESGLGVTLSYWETESDLKAWGRDKMHQKAMAFGQDEAYLSYRLEIAEIQSVSEQ